MPELLLIGGATDEMLARMTEVFEVHHWSDCSDPAQFLADRGAAIEYVATNGHDGVPAQVLDGLPNLKMVSCYGVGYDAIDTDVCAARGIVVTHTPNVLNAEVATTALLLWLACTRQLLAGDAHVRSGAWERDGNMPLTRSADHRTVGILGLGRIGQAIADKVAPFDATVVYHSRSAKDVPYRYYGDLVEMARDCDVLIVITPGGAGTRHLVNAQVMEALGPEGILINVARGSVVDEAALITALETGALGMAGLDVFEAEPHVPAALRALPNVVLLPHVGSGTVETRAAMGALTVDNLLSFAAAGTVLSPVPEVQGFAKRA